MEIRNLNVKISKASKDKLEDYRDKHRLANMDDAVDEFVQKARFGED